MKAMLAAEQHHETLRTSLAELEEHTKTIEVTEELSNRLESLVSAAAESRRLTHDKIDRVSRQVTTALHKEQHQVQRNANDAASKFQEMAQKFRNRMGSVAANSSGVIEDRDGDQ